MPARPKRKRCTKCRKRHPLECFGKNRYSKDGRHYYCKICAALKRMNWYANNKAKAAAATARWKAKIARKNGALDGETARA